MRHLREYIRNIIIEKYVPAEKTTLESVYVYKKYIGDSLIIGFFNKSLIDDFLGASILQPTKIGKDIAKDINNNNSGGLRSMGSKQLDYIFETWDFDEPTAAKQYGSKIHKGDGWKIYAAIDGMIQCDVIPDNPNVYKVTYTATHAGTGFGPILKDYALSVLDGKILIPDRGKKTVKQGRRKVEIPSVSDDALRYYQYIRNKQEYDKYELILMDDENMKITASTLDDVPLHYPESSFLKKSGLKKYPAQYNPRLGDLTDKDLYDVGVRLKRPILFSDDNDILKKAIKKWEAIHMDIYDLEPATFHDVMEELLAGYFGVVYKLTRYKGAIRKVK